MKKIINKPETLVMEMCNGIAMAHTNMEFIKKYKIIKKKKINPNKVSLISGGGSGHEPAHAGFIGTGALDAAVCGDVFASPSQIQVYQAIKETVSEKGTLLIIKNYSGDMMNFKNALYLAQEDGVEVDYVKVDDDIAVCDSLYTVGRRGVAGTVFVHKITGAAAEKGMKLSEIKAIAEKTIKNVKSLGFAFTSCTVPAKGTPTFELGEDEMEYGVGIHGEPGIRREKVISADELSKRIVNALVNELHLTMKDEVAILINGFGATPLQELYILNNSINRELNNLNISIQKEFVGNYMTSIDMAGASVSILKLDEELKELLFDKCLTPALVVDEATDPVKYNEVISPTSECEEVNYSMITDESYAMVNNERITLNNIIYIVDKMSEFIIKNEVPFCELDAHAGDGDFGMSIAKGFRQLKKEWNEITKEETIGGFLSVCSMIIMEYCGGASGPIWGSAFRAAAKNVGGADTLCISGFANMMHAAVIGIQATGERSFGRGAVVGDKTLMDALIPCSMAWTECASANMKFADAFRVTAKAAVNGAKETEKIVARMGRAGTVGERSLGYPDAGAYALGVIFTAIAESIK